MSIGQILSVGLSRCWIKAVELKPGEQDVYSSNPNGFEPSLSFPAPISQSVFLNRSIQETQKDYIFVKIGFTTQVWLTKRNAWTELAKDIVAELDRRLHDEVTGVCGSDCH